MEQPSEKNPPSTMEQPSGYGAEIIANPALCRRLLTLQEKAEGPLESPEEAACAASVNTAGHSSTEVPIDDPEVKSTESSWLQSLSSRLGCASCLPSIASPKACKAVTAGYSSTNQPPPEVEPIKIKSTNQAAPEESAAFKVGDVVEVHSLTEQSVANKPELNGRSGVILRQKTDMRWAVLISGQGKLPPKEVGLRPANMQKKSLESILGVDAVWECTDEGKNLRVIGLARLPTEVEAKSNFGAVIEIACRGSRNEENFVTNFKTELVPWDLSPEVKVHQGFSEAHASLRKSLREKVSESLAALPAKDGKPVLVYVVGHSLGGALATLISYDLAALSGYTVRCATFGCPRVGDEAFAKAYISVVPSTARFVNGPDPVARVPVNPNDPFDDGPILGQKFQEAAHKQHEKRGAQNYFHVCKSTTLGRKRSGFVQIITTLDASMEKGAAGGFDNFMTQHFFAEYVKELNALIDGTANNDTAANKAEVEKAIKGVIGGIFAGMKKKSDEKKRLAALAEAGSAPSSSAEAGSAASPSAELS